MFWALILLLTAGAALNSDVPGAGRVACGLIAIVLACLGLHSWWGGIEVSARQVVVRRWVGRTAIVPWSEVDRFALVPNGRGGAWVAVILMDGRQLRTQGLAVNSVDSSRGHEIVSELEAARPC